MLFDAMKNLGMYLEKMFKNPTLIFPNISSSKNDNIQTSESALVNHYSETIQIFFTGFIFSA